MKKKRLVVFYSRTGNTKKAAVEIATSLKADIDEIVDKKDRRGAKGWILAGRDATLGRLTEIRTTKSPKAYDLVIIGTPIWAFTITPAIRTYFEENKGKFKKVAFFSTSGNVGIEKTFAEMEKLSKKPKALLSLTEATFTQILDMKKENNLQKIKDFCKKIRKE